MTQGLQIFHAIPDFFICMCLDCHQTFVLPHLSSRTQLLPQVSSSFKIQVLIPSMKPLLPLEDLNSYLSMFLKETVLIVMILYLTLSVPFSQWWTHWGQGLCTFKFMVDFFFLGELKKKKPLTTYATQKGHQMFCHDCTFNLVRGLITGKGIQHLY